MRISFQNAHAFVEVRFLGLYYQLFHLIYSFMVFRAGSLALGEKYDDHNISNDTLKNFSVFKCISPTKQRPIKRKLYISWHQQFMAYCFAPQHNLNQFWIIFIWTLGTNRLFVIVVLTILFKETGLKIVVSAMLTILYRSQCIPHRASKCEWIPVVQPWSYKNKHYMLSQFPNDINWNHHSRQISAWI